MHRELCSCSERDELDIVVEFLVSPSSIHSESENETSGVHVMVHRSVTLSIFLSGGLS